MAGSDLFELLVTLSIIGAIVFVVFYISQGTHRIIQTTKEDLKSRGYDVTSSGVSIKTNKRFDREAYLDATQRGLVRALGASSVGQEPKPVLGHSAWGNHETKSHANDNGTAGTHHLGHNQHDEQDKGHLKHFWKGIHRNKKAS